MQGLNDILGSSGMDLGSLGGQFGLSPEQTQSAMGSLLPAVLGGFHKTDPDRVAAAIDTKGANAAGGPNSSGSVGGGQLDTAAGNDVLGQIFGSKDVSRQVADHAAGQSGVSSTVLKAMLPIVAAMVARHLAQNGGGAGGLGGMLGSILGGGDGAGGGAGGLGGILGGLTGGGGGNPLDAILGRQR